MFQDYKGNKMKLIVFTGLKGSGKNTATNALSDIIGWKQAATLTAEFAFADPLKNIVKEGLNIDNSYEEFLKRSNIKPFNGLTLREVYQLLGEAIKSEVGRNIWADLTINRIQDFVNNLNPDYIIVTDLRYTNEETSLRKFADDYGFELYIIKMQNTNLVNNDTHISETQIDDIQEDFLIKASDIDEIKIQMEEIFNAISE